MALCLSQVCVLSKWLNTFTQTTQHSDSSFLLPNVLAKFECGRVLRSQWAPNAGRVGYKSSAVAEMGDHLSTIDMGRK